MPIEPIDRASVLRLTSGQVLLDLASAVKELLENSLDAGATACEIRFREYGVGGFEVHDNGTGIDETDHASIGLRSYTSKLSSFEDLETVSTLGFRGEALSSICNLAKLTVVTATAAVAPLGHALEFDHLGKLTTTTRVARQRGTTVSVTELFATTPVRRRELEKNSKREFSKVTAAINAYALINTGVRITLTNVDAKGKKATLLASAGGKTMRDTYSSVFESKTLVNVIELKLDLEVAAEKSVLKALSAEELTTRVVVTGLVSKPSQGSGRASGDRQFLFVNKRPFASTKIIKAFNEAYRSFNATQTPCVIANFVLATDAYDVNVTPDKRTVLLHSEANLITALKSALETTFSPFRSTFKTTQVALVKPSPPKKRASSSSSSTAALVDPPPRPRSPLRPPSPSPSPVAERQPSLAVPDADDAPVRPRKSPVLGSGPLVSAPSHSDDEDAAPRSTPAWPPKPRQMTLSTTGASWALHDGPSAAKKRKTTTVKGGAAVVRSSLVDDEAAVASDGSDDVVEVISPDRPIAPPPIRNRPSEVSTPDELQPEPEVAAEIEDDVEADDLAAMRSAHMRELATEGAAERPSPAISRVVGDGIVRAGGESGDVAISFDMLRVRKLYARRAALPSQAAPEPSATQAGAVDADLKQAGVGGDADEAQSALSRCVSQSDFALMEVVGQFNCGFILARRRVSAPPSVEHDDLWILDQHASDEKRNFEALQASTKLESQRELVPRPLHLSAADELLVMDSLDILQANGFGIHVDEDAPPGERCNLVAHPTSKSTTFGVTDLEELIHLMRENDDGKMVRPSKVRAMFASRACRMSTMIGDALTVSQMTAIVRRMEALKQPWSCPHGRPTMRFLSVVQAPARDDRHELDLSEWTG